ncbi:unnamed protein product [Closterium sp. NIES-54]
MATITAVAAARCGQRRSLPLRDDPTPQQLREWVLQRAYLGGGGFGFQRTAQRRQQSQQETFSPRMLTPGVSESAAALGARASPATSPSSAGALHTFTLDSGASRCFFRDCTSLTPLAALVPVSLADPVGGPVVARASTVLSCPAVPSSSLSGLHLPMFSTNLVSNAAIQDVWADTLFPGGQRVAICTCSRTGRHLATFIRRPGSSLYTLTTTAAQVAEAGQVAASSQVSASGQLAASCSCPVLSHQTLLWHHHLGHPSLPRLRSMHSRLLVFGLPRSLPSLPRSPAVPCFPCIQGRQRAAPHSSDFPPTTPPLQTLHKDVWGPAPVGGTDQERYFLLVVDNYTRYTTVFPLRCKADVSGVLIPWIRATRRQLREWFSQDFPVLRLHSDRGGEFSSDLLAEFCRDEGIVQSSTFGPVSLSQRPRPHSGGWGRLAMRRCFGSGARSPLFAMPKRTSSPLALSVASSLASPPTPRRGIFTTHARVESSPPMTSPLTSLSGPAPSGVSQVDRPPLVEPLEVSSDSSGLAEGDDPAADDAAATRRSPRLETPPGFPPRPSSPPPQPAAVDSGAENAGAEPGGAEKEGEGSGGATSGGAGSWGATAGGADSGGPASSSGGGAVGDPAGGIPGGGGYGPTGAGAASPGGSAVAGGTGGTAGGAGGAAGAGDTRGAAGAGGARATSPRGATSAGGAGPTSPGGTAGARGVGATAGGTTGAAGSGGTGGTAGAGAARAGGTAGVQGAGGATGAASTRGAGGTTGARGPHAAGGRGAAGAGGAGGAAGAAGAGGAGVGGAGAAGTELRGPFFYPHPQSSLPPPDSVHRQVLSLPSSTGLPLPLLCPPTDQPQPQLLPGSPLPTPAPHTEHVVLPEPPVSSLSYVPDPESDFAHAASATITRLLATVVTDPDLEPTAAFALVTELFDFAARSRLDYIASLVTKSASVCPPSVRGELALGSDVLEDRQFELECLVATLPRFASMLLCPHPDALDIPTPRSYADAIAGEYTSHWETAMDGEMASWKSTGTYVVEVPPPGANIVDGMWIFRVKRPPGSPPAFKACYVARGFIYGLLQAPRKWHDTLRTTLAALGFAPSSLFLRTDTTLPPFYVLVYVDNLVLTTTDTKALALDRARRIITLTQSHMVHQVLQRFGFQFSSPQPTPLSTGHSLSAPSSDEFVEPSGPYPELVGCLMYLMTCTRPDLAYTLSLLARYVAPSRHQKVHWDVAKRVLRYLCSASGMGLVLGGQGSVVLTGHSDASWAEDQATQRSSQGYTFSLGSGSVSWRSTRSSSVLSSSYEAEIYAGAMAA